MKLSVITVNYNDRTGLTRTIRSVVEQSFENFEYIIVDGGSSDGSVEIIKHFEEKISYWVTEPDTGIYNAMNKAIEVARGEYCIFMNSGDSFYDSEVLQKVFSEFPTEDIICGDTYTINDTKSAPKEITLEYLFSHSICHQSAFIKTSLMKKYKYDEKYKIVADRKFFLQTLILENCTYRPINVKIVNYDLSGYSSKNPHLSRMEYDQVLEELFPARIRIDYGRRERGVLYGDSMYEKLFYEINLRQYRYIIYQLTVIVLHCVSLVKASAKFIRNYPFRLLPSSNNK